jgi:hypothetical protein
MIGKSQLHGQLLVLDREPVKRGFSGNLTGPEERHLMGHGHFPAGAHRGGDGLVSLFVS